ncbi:MAG: DUF1156 domain-containing protein [Caldilineaceae bacterium]|nr:DUF1156 domain-containing protein [Caldilineaceae bacterium]MBP8106572.1 DUF1156 domain-containing protein [Caldilineaceae bacterium]MBP9071371.1 DUF1156 domain-containing protein [Caldilineaceae bacterium]
MSHPKKLIEVALPLEAINKESAREKSIRHGHPSTLHLWWARRPLAACRAVLFAQMVDDPSSHPELFPTDVEQEAERQRLFRLIEELVKWENINNRTLLDQAHAEIVKYAPDGVPPPVLDPFAGGGSIPLEAQRLGLEAHASDLNPVAVLINKALIEIPPKFAGQPPINPQSRGEGKRRTVSRVWQGAEGLAEDVRHYGQWMRDEAERRIGHLYPTVAAVQEANGEWRHATQSEIQNQASKIQELTVIAWLWARTVTCPNPACGARMPLVRSFDLSKKTGKRAWVEPVVDRSVQPPLVRFKVKTGKGKTPDGTVERTGATCLCCNTPVPFDHVREEGRSGRMGAQLMTIVAQGDRTRIYLPPTLEQEAIAASAQPQNVPDTNLPEQALGFRVQLYGMTKHRDLFTERQLVILSTFSDLVWEARGRVHVDATSAGLPAEWAASYADGVATYLAFGLSKTVNRSSSLCTWKLTVECPGDLFARQTVSMVWDYSESNALQGTTGSFDSMLKNTIRGLEVADIGRGKTGWVEQQDARAFISSGNQPVISTDPPYYDNVPYADLSDVFYTWLRRSLVNIYPDLFGTLLVPKHAELIAEPFRQGTREASQEYFEKGLQEFFSRTRQAANPDYPVTIYYAFKQAETTLEPSKGDASSASTGWETMLEGLVSTGYVITGTWPIRTERQSRTRSLGSNALATSVVLVCRIRPEGASLATRRDFLSALQHELPAALRDLQRGNIAPVDLAQAAIGPGMAIYSRYPRVIEADGSAMRVRTALALINQALDEYLSEQEGEFDADTRWALAWFEQFAFDEAEYGMAETLSKAKNTSVTGMVEAGILHARAGKVRLLRREELSADWNPAKDRRPTVWEATQHLIRRMDEQGELAAAVLLAQLGPLAAPARDLAYRLYTLCERKGWASEALPYNALVVAWSDVGRMAGERKGEGSAVQGRLEL